MTENQSQHQESAARELPSSRVGSVSRLLCPPPAVLWLLAIAVAVFLAGANLFLGEPNQDEGWYLYAARLVSQGQKPYVDFASTQGPVMPFVYSLAQPLVDRWGVAGGRAFTILIGFLCSLGAAFLAARLAPAGRRNATAFVAFALVAVNVYQSCFFTVVKTYALTAFLLVLGFLALTWVDRKRAWPAAFLSGLFLSLAAGTRLSAGAVLPVVFLALLVFARGEGPETNLRAGAGVAVSFAAGAALTLCLLFVPFLIRAPESLRFALFDYHAGREAGGLMPLLAYKAGFISRVVQDYFVAMGLLLVVVAVRLSRGRGTGARDGDSVVWALWISVLAVTVVHFMAPFPYDDYQVMIYPLFAVGVAVGLMRMAEPVGSPVVSTASQGLIPACKADGYGIGMVVLLLCAASAFSSPVNQNWFIGQRDRLWWPIKKSFPMAMLREAGDYIRSITKPGDILLTQDAYLAVESGRMLPKGMELGPFCYFPEWSSEKALRRHVLNRDMLMEILENSDAPAAAFSGYGLSIQSPEIRELPVEEQQALRAAVEKRYQLVRTIETFGHAETTLKVYKRK